MKLGRRVALHFLLRLGLIFILVLVVTMFFSWMTYLSLDETKANFSPNSAVGELADSTVIQDGKVEIRKGLRERLDQEGYWIQILDPNGKEIYQHQKPREIPNSYTGYTLSQFHTDQLSTPYRFYTWYKTINEPLNLSYTFIIAKPKPFGKLLVRAVEETKAQDGKIDIPDSLKKEIKKSDSWLQILDQNGKELYSYARPSMYPTQVPPGYFVDRYERDPYMIYQTRELDGKLVTFLLKAGENKVTTNRERETWQIISPLVGFISIILTPILVAFMFGQRLGRPVLHAIRWIENLTIGKWEEPVDKKGIPVSLDPKTGKLRRPYRIYEEMLVTLRKFTRQLQQNEKERQKLEKTREEWIAGISHDLKTPLSSVKGFADLLAEPTYHWTEDEVRRYSDVIREKAGHMENLIEDLNLTYRLKNEALPLSLTEEDLVEMVRRCVIDLANSASAAEQIVLFDPKIDSYNYKIDQKWFQRALTNLLVNASVHNPPGTTIKVIIELDWMKGGLNQTNTLDIIIKDDGRGMDEETQKHLFDRYYRGTNTKNKGVGTGLGMAIARQLIEAHHGHIEIKSQIGKGTTLKVSLPVDY